MSWNDPHISSGSSGPPTPTPPAPGPILETIDTSVLEPADVGKAVFVDSDSHVALTSNDGLPQGRFKGIWLGVDNQVAVGGGPVDAQFTVDGGAPTAGNPVFLANGDDDSNTGDGKLTATPPSFGGAVIDEVGICEDATNYGIDGTCSILIQPKEPVVLSAQPRE